MLMIAGNRVFPTPVGMNRGMETTSLTTSTPLLAYFFQTIPNRPDPFCKRGVGVINMGL